MCRRRASETCCSGVRYRPAMNVAKIRRATNGVTGKGAILHARAKVHHVFQRESRFANVPHVTTRASARRRRFSLSSTELTECKAKNCEPADEKSRTGWSFHQKAKILPIWWLQPWVRCSNARPRPPVRDTTSITDRWTRIESVDITHTSM